MRYLINANFASHFAGAFLKTTLIYLYLLWCTTVIFNSYLFISILTQTTELQYITLPSGEFQLHGTPIMLHLLHFSL